MHRLDARIGAGSTFDHEYWFGPSSRWPFWQWTGGHFETVAGRKWLLVVR